MSEEKIVAFHPHYMRLFSDAVIALVCSQLHYWYTPNKAGKSRLSVFKDDHYWVVKHYKDWYTECGLSVKQARRAIDTLVDIGVLIRIDSGYKGKHATFVRVSHLQGKSSLGPGEYITDSLYPSNVPYGALRNALQGTSNTESVSENVKDLKQPAAKATGHQLTEHSYPVGIAEEAMRKAMTTSAVLQAKYAVKEEINLDCGTGVGLMRIWSQAVPRYNESVKFIKEFTLAEKSQFKRLSKTWGVGLAPNVLLTILRGWVGFTKYTEKMSGAFKTPLVPTLFFVVKYAEQAMNYHLECVEAENDPAAMVGLKASPSPEKQAFDPSAKVVKNSAVKSGNLDAANCTKPAICSEEQDSDEDHQTTLADLLDYQKTKAKANVDTGKT